MRLPKALISKALITGVFLLAPRLVAASPFAFVQEVHNDYNKDDHGGATISQMNCPAITPHAGNMLLVIWNPFMAGIPGFNTTATDTAGNTWDNTSLPQGYALGSHSVILGGAFALNVSGTTNDVVTLQFTNPVGYVSCKVLEYSGVAASNALDATSTFSYGVTPLVTSNPLSTHSANDLVIAIAGEDWANGGPAWLPGSIGGVPGNERVDDGWVMVMDQTFSSAQSNITATATDQCANGECFHNEMIVTAFKLDSAAPTVPTVTLKAAPTSIAPGGSSTLSWTTTNAGSAILSGPWAVLPPPSVLACPGGQSMPLNGSSVVTPSASAYYILCVPNGADPIVEANVFITVSGGQPGSPNVLKPEDFTYLGYYDTQFGGGNSAYAQGLTYRYVNGDLRFLNWQLDDRLVEFSIAGKNFGDLITAPTNQWSNLGCLLDFKGFWWDEAGQRLWSTSAVDYTVSVVPVQICTRTLNDDGTISNLHGPIGLQGLNAKRVYGGAAAVPAWFQQKYKVGPYVVGWGGYTSLVAQGGSASMGPTMYAIPDPSNYAVNSEIPASAYKTIMDAVSGTTRDDWYKQGGTPPFDRGARLTFPLNYFDGGGDNLPPNGTWDGVPPDPPLATGNWLSPAPDGLGRWLWGDSYYNTGVWIDTPEKTGFVAIASLGAGKCWYNYSTMHYESRVFELHIFDPAQLGESIQGTRQPWNVKPSGLVQLTLPGLGDAWNGNSPVLNVGGATYDPVTQRLYLIGMAGGGWANRLYVFQVNAGNTPVIARMTATPSSGKAPLTVSFDASGTTDSNGTISSYQWNFGDGQGGSGVTISHTYTNGGSYLALMTATDNHNASGVASRIISAGVDSDNPPVAQNQPVTASAGAGKAIMLQATDPDNQSLTYTIVTSPAHGTLTGTPPQVIYTANPNYSGSDSFTFKANDGTLDSNVAVVSITVTSTPGGGPGGLTTPTLNLAKYLPINAQITAGYNGTASADHFTWTFTPANSIPSPSRSPAFAGVTASAQAKNFDTPGVQANLATQNLTLGPYQVTVKVFDKSGNSAASNSVTVTLVPADLSTVRVYPNPWRSDRHANKSITFDGLAVNSTVKIFTVSGHWVKTLPLSSSSVTWDLTNDAGDKVASGNYVYLITTDSGGKKTGQVVVIK